MGINDLRSKIVFLTIFYQLLFDDPCKSILHFHATTILLHISLECGSWTCLELCFDFYWVIFNQREMEMNISFRKQTPLELCFNFHWVIFNQREVEMNFSFRKLEMGKRHQLYL